MIYENELVISWYNINSRLLVIDENFYHPWEIQCPGNQKEHTDLTRELISKFQCSRILLMNVAIESASCD